MSGSPVAFLSYTRADDRGHGGLISDIKEQLEIDVRLLTGRQDFEIFQDTDDIEPGQPWESRLHEALEQAGFFLPVITPSYFNSGPCTFELLKFHGLEAATGRNDLIIPIYLITAPVVENEELRTQSPVAQLIHTRNWVDWRDFYPKPVKGEEGKRRIRALAIDIEQALSRIPEKHVAPEVDNERVVELEAAIEEEQSKRSTAERRAENLVAEQANLRTQLKRLEEERAAAASSAVPDSNPSRPGSSWMTKAAAAALAVWAVVASERWWNERQLRLAANGDTDQTTTQSGQVEVEPAAGSPQSFKDCDECPEMVVVPAGEFMMGSPVGVGDSDEQPLHPVTIPKPFAVGRFEVTFDEWDACVEQGGCRGHKPEDKDWGRGRRPVINVSWDDAKAYVAWLSKKAGEEYRLLSEAEWEYAARAGTETAYFFGGDIRPDQANYRGNVSKTAEVGSYPANAFGLHDMHGNVWEWCEDVWHGSYVGAPSDGTARTGDGDQSRRVLRGGSWNYDPWNLRSAFRSRDYAVIRNILGGFRVAKDLP